MKKVSNILLVLAVTLILLPTISSQIEIYKSEKEVKEVKEVEEVISEDNIEEIDLDNQLIEIDKIDLKLPIKHGATHENMRTSVATMTHKEVKRGKNLVLAGHRNLRKGKNFNRLNELEVGDTIKVISNIKEVDFKVTSKEIVKPEQLDILKDTGKTEITLVTCYPIGISTHRLIVKGEMVDE